jgi:L-alanine-DL-glutamate epimerase-like enolase superfamily enzyme
MPPSAIPIQRIETRVYRVPTDGAEADGTLQWDSTTMVTAEVIAGGRSGFGYSYTDAAAKSVIDEVLAPALLERDALSIPALWSAMVARVRNLGWRGICATAISAVDVALWDLKARIFGVPLVQLFGAERDAVPVYGSGGFTSYAEERLTAQLSDWVHKDGCSAVKMKIGSASVDDDLRRMRGAKEAIGRAGLMIDANGAYDRKQALAVAEHAAALGVEWFEEPVSSDDLEGLRLLRDRAPAPVEVAAGEYGYESFYFRHILEAGAVDVLQVDATRCCGYTGFMRAAALADAHTIPVSAHTAPALHLPVCCAIPRLRHIEWFHDHVRIERIMFDGAPVVSGGAIAPERTRLGHGLSFKRADAERFAA